MTRDISAQQRLGLDLSGKNVVVTGGCGGIGFAICDALAMLGARVAIWDIDAEKAKDKAASLGPQHLGCACDVTDEAAVVAAALHTTGQIGPVSILVNNAGAAGPTHPISEIDAEEWRAIHALNLDSVHYTSRQFASDMITLGWGRIVNIASVAAKEGNANAAAYSSAKAGVIAYTKAQAKELAQTGVLINCITPAAVDTPFFDTVPEEHRRLVTAKIPMGRLGKAEEIARLVTFLATDMCQFSTGAVFDISGGRATY
ncbi:SDR family oxidoreductase [Rhodobacteraceae bacterium D3-12]|nr:SDR family oxidoreductase [Rhodobacteraceae bacterium D3-12]